MQVPIEMKNGHEVSLFLKRLEFRVVSLRKKRFVSLHLFIKGFSSN
jgi:hypothetical protein